MRKLPVLMQAELDRPKSFVEDNPVLILLNNITVVVNIRVQRLHL